KGSTDRISVCTATIYLGGIIAVFHPESSWVARWQKMSKYVRRMYAVRAKIEYRTEDVEAVLESLGIE
ncbi:hypothetical protein EDD16DRAFT_1465840, partial [Pisolithus croceorrhizus]